jgi:hypothetical protein
MFIETRIPHTVIHISHDDPKEEEKKKTEDSDSEKEEEENIDLADLLDNL